MAETLTKAVLVDRLHRHLGLTRREGATVVDEVFELLRQALERGDRVKIAGFGTWVVREKAARQGRNPRTEAPLVIAPRRVLVFRPSDLLRDRMNADRELAWHAD